MKELNKSQQCSQLTSKAGDSCGDEKAGTASAGILMKSENEYQYFTRSRIEGRPRNPER